MLCPKCAEEQFKFFNSSNAEASCWDAGQEHHTANLPRPSHKILQRNSVKIVSPGELSLRGADPPQFHHPLSSPDSHAHSSRVQPKYLIHQMAEAKQTVHHTSGEEWSKTFTNWEGNSVTFASPQMRGATSSIQGHPTQDTGSGVPAVSRRTPCNIPRSSEAYGRILSVTRRLPNELLPYQPLVASIPCSTLRQVMEDSSLEGSLDLSAPVATPRIMYDGNTIPIEETTHSS